MKATTAMQLGTIEQRYIDKFSQSQRLYEQAVQLFPSGITHDSRFMRPFPVYIKRGEGSHKWDVQGHELIDWWVGHGALLLGHSHPGVVAAVQQQMMAQTHPGASHELEIQWAQCVQQLVPSVERLRFVSSGTEATMMAIRLARTYTGKSKVLKFHGHFHGWNDLVIQDANPPYGVPVPGVARDLFKRLVRIVPNDVAVLEATLQRDRDIGCVIIEPTGGHFGEVPIHGPFLHELRRITEALGVLLIFDEVVSGFRVHSGGAQEHFQIRPDLTVMAKILAGGLPGACVGGRKDVLELLEIGQPVDRKMPHPGTFNANPLSAAAGIAALGIVQSGEPCRKANDIGAMLRVRLNELFVQLDLDWIAYGEFSRFKILTGYQGPRSTDDDFLPYEGTFEKLDPNAQQQVQHAFRAAMLLNDVDLPGLKGMTGAAHTAADVDRTIDAARNAITMLREEGFV